MFIAFHRPHGALAPYVELFTYYTGYIPEVKIERLLPEGVIEIIIDLTDEPKYTYDHVTLRPNQSFRRSWVSGMRDSFLSIGAGPNSSMFVIRFRPGQAYPFLKQPMDHLYNRVIDGDCLYGRPIDVLREQLLHAPDPAEKFRFGEKFLYGLLNGGAEIHSAISHAVGRICRSPSASTLRDVVRETGYSHKHVISLFERYIGVRPKTFVRIMKFQQVVHAVDAMQQVNWAQVAADCGYYDQAHLIHDFKFFSGFTPEVYFKMKGSTLNWVPISVR
jgi:AraC-like DNA-binding protein